MWEQRAWARYYGNLARRYWASFETIATAPDQFAAYIRTEIDKWAKVVKASGARAE